MFVIPLEQQRVAKISFGHGTRGKGKRAVPTTTCYFELINMATGESSRASLTVRKWKEEMPNMALARYFAFWKLINNLWSSKVVTNRDKKLLWKHYTHHVRVPWHLIPTEMKP